MSLAQDVVCVRGEDGLLHSTSFSVYFKLSSSDQSVLQWLVSRLPAGAAAEDKSDGGDGSGDGTGKTFARTLMSTIGMAPPSQPRTEQKRQLRGSAKPGVASPRRAERGQQADQREEAAVVAAAERRLSELLEHHEDLDQQEQEQQEQQQEQEERPSVGVFVNGALTPALEMVVDAKGRCAFAATGTAQPAPSTLADLPLRPGQNAVAFKCGDVIVEASIWLWGAHETLIVSDVDGTISASDVKGYITTVHLNKYHHTHRGVCRLYSHLAEAHGVRFLYLTSRPLSLLPATRAYIKGARQDGGHQLPAGPIICSPYGLARVLWKELIEKSIRAFKQQALLDVAETFYRAGRPRSRPVFAVGFGNKTQDALAYLGAHVPSDAIFIINPQSEVRLHAHMAAEEEAEAEKEAQEAGDAGGGLLRGTYRSGLQKLRGKIPGGWLGGGGTSTPPPPSPPSPKQQEQQQSPDAAFEAAEGAPAQPQARPVAAVERMTMSRGGSIDGDDELFASASSSLPPTSFPPFSSYSDDRLLQILEKVLARDRAPCHEAQPPAPPAAPVGDSNA